MGTVTLTIDGQDLSVPKDYTVLQAAEAAGVDIPTLCYHPSLQVFNSCLLCVVEVEGARRPLLACGTQVRDGMVVDTKSEKVIKARRAVLEFLLINHPLDCPICDQSGECKLQDYCFEHGQSTSRYTEEKNTFQWIQRFMSREISGPMSIR